MAGGDSGGLPRQAQIVYLAAAIDHTDPSWDAFVVAHELEPWPGDRWWFETTAEPFEPRSEHIDAVAGPFASIIGRRS
jgi:hypothetical protein